MNFSYTKILTSGTTALAALCLASGAADAAQITIAAGSQRDNGGGEFLITGGDSGWAQNIARNNYVDGARNGNDTTATGFFTFCIEGNEYISLPHSYDYQVTSGSLDGGINTNFGDPVSAGTAYLYGLFARGGLGSLYNYNESNGGGSAGALQNAIWWLEGEGGSLSSGYEALLDAEFGDENTARLDVAIPSASLGRNVTASDYGVAAINVGPPSQNYPNQDQLVYLGGGFQRVPDGGATLALLGLALGGLGFMRRKAPR